MAGEQLDPFAAALEESGGRIVGQEGSTSTEEQGLQTLLEESNSTGTTSEGTEQTSSETQGAVNEEEGSVVDGEGGENPTQEEGESERKSGFVDLNSEGEASSEEGASENSNELPFDVSEMFGESFQSIEDVVEYTSELEAHIDELESKTPEFANEFVQKMNEYVLNGGDPVYFAKVNSIDIDGLNPIDALKLDLQWQHNISEAEAQAFINQKYSVDEYDEDDGEINPSAVQLKIDATNAKKNLKERQADNTLVEQQPSGLSEEEWSAKQQESFDEQKAADDFRMWDEREGWAPEVDKAMDSLKNNGLMIDLGNGKAFSYTYGKDDTYSESLITKVDQALYDSGTSRSDNPELAKSIAENIFFLENRAEILKSFGDEIRSMKDEEYHRAMNNPSSVKRGDPISKGERTAVTAEETMTKLWNQ